MRVSIDSREKKLAHFKQHITIRSQRIFCHLLQKRSYRGELIINHGTASLSLNVLSYSYIR